MAEIRIDHDAVANVAWNEWYARVAPQLEAAAVREAPRDTGELAASVDIRRTGPRSAVLEATAPHAAVVTTGHGEIRPKDPDGVLTWLSKLTGDRVYAKVVAAVEGNPFLLRAARSIGLRVQ